MNTQLVFDGYWPKSGPSIFAKIHEIRRAEKISSDTKQNPSKIEVSDKNKNLWLSPRFQVAGKIKQIGGESNSWGFLYESSRGTRL